MRKERLSIIISAALMALATDASAHVTLEQSEARVGASYKAVLKVPHGCEGTATTSIRVRLPAGFIAVKPMPKPGWTLAIKEGPYDKTYNFFHGRTLKEGVTEISWSGGKLPDAWYDEFVLAGFLAGDLKPGETLYFPVVQECEKGTHRWIEIPEAGKSAADLPEPAPALRLVPAAAPRH
jgi:periplasmic copper chaperone A